MSEMKPNRKKKQRYKCNLLVAKNGLQFFDLVIRWQHNEVRSEVVADTRSVRGQFRIIWVVRPGLVSLLFSAVRAQSVLQ